MCTKEMQDEKRLEAPPWHRCNAGVGAGRCRHALTYVPIYIFGFTEAPLFAYVTFVSIQATFVHANVGFKFGRRRWVLATPQFQHWHHGADVGG
jgi:sterol desaturase/sphingolipid hydroxylase (fatty acid hydroxylase superfamily)